MNNYINTCVKICRNKILYIIIIGILMAIICSGIKLLFSDVATRTGSYLFTRTVQVVQNQVKDDFDYRGFLEAPGNYYQFIKNAEQSDFDFTKVDSAWKRKNETEQIDWLKKHIKIENYKGNVVSVTVTFDANVTRDVDYMNQHGKLLAHDFVNQSEKSIRAVMPEAEFKVINEEQALPIVTPINRKKMIIEFAIIGFALGVFGSTTCFYLWEVSKEHRNKIK